MSQELKLGATGLDVNANPFDGAPSSSMTQADDIVIRRPNVIEPRRGLPPLSYTFGVGSSRAAVGVAWKGKRILHHGDSTLTQDTGSTYVDYSGTYACPDTTVAHMKFCESSRRLFFTSSAGLYAMDELAAATTGTNEPGNPRAAGLPRGLEFRGYPDNTTNGIMVPDSARAYRVVWGLKDINDAVILGPPSGRVVVKSVPAFTIAIGGMQFASTVVICSKPTHGLTVGQKFTLSPGEANFPSGVKTVSADDNSGFFYSENGPASAFSTATQTITPTTGNITLNIPIPNGITTQHFVQVYASRLTTSASTDPGDELYLVHESFPTLADITARTLTVTDVAPDSLLGPPLYTNANQEGIDQANDQPPLCRDVETFSGCLVMGRTTEPHRVTLTLLGISGTGGLTDQDQIRIFRPADNAGNAYRGSISTSETGSTFTIRTGYSASQNVEMTARSFVRCVNRTEANIRAFYISGPNDPPGRILFEYPSLPGKQFQVYLEQGASGRSEAFYPTLSRRVTFTSITRVGTTVTVTSATSHSFSTGQQVQLTTSPSSSFPTGYKTVTGTGGGGTTFTYTESGSAGSAGAGEFFAAEPILASSASVAPNGLAISKPEEPEAVPLTNRLYGSHGDDELLRVRRLGRTLFLFYKLGGLWRVTGEYGDFRIEEFDPTVKLIAPDSVQSVGNRLYCLTDRGVVPISEVGAGDPISDPIRPTLMPLLTSLTLIQSTTFAVGYEAEREYVLGIVTASSDTFATQIFVWNENTRTWVRWVKSAKCGLVDPVDGKLYLASATSNALLQERKTFTATDNQDATGTAIPSAWKWSIFTGGGPAAMKRWQGIDVLYGLTEFSNSTLSITTDLDESVSTVALAGYASDASVSGPRSIPATLPPDKSMSTQLAVKLTHGSASAENWRVNGAVVRFSPVREGVGRQ